MGENKKDNIEEKSDLAKQIKQLFQHCDMVLGISSNIKDLDPAWLELLEHNDKLLSNK